MSWADDTWLGLRAKGNVEKATDFTRPSTPRRALPQASFSVFRTPQRTLPTYASEFSLPQALQDGLFEHRTGLGGIVLHVKDT